MKVFDNKSIRFSLTYSLGSCLLLLALIMNASSCSKNSDELAAMRGEPNEEKYEPATRAWECVIHTTQAGILDSLLTKKETDEGFVRTDLTSLAIVGPMNEDDLKVLRGLKASYKLDISKVQLKDEKGKDVYKLPYRSFNGASVQQVSLPENLSGIEEEAFYHSNITAVDIPESVAIIKRYAFSDCDLKSVKLPASLKYIEYGAFSYCDSLKQLEIPSSVEYIGPSAFSNLPSVKSLVISGSVKYIGDNAFRDCSKLEEVVLPQGLEYLGETAFYYCTKIKSVTLPSNLCVVAPRAFSRCENLTTIKGWDNWTCIPEGMFEYCTNLSSVTLPATLKRIEKRAFNRCPLHDFALPDGIEFLGEHSLYIVKQHAFRFPASLKTVEDLSLGESDVAVVYWDAEIPMPKLSGHQIPYIYMAHQLPYDKENGHVIRKTAEGGYVAEVFELKEDADYLCPQSFTARKIVFRRTYYNQNSDMKSFTSWETIALPFNVSAVTVPPCSINGIRLPKRSFKPFGSSDMGDAKPFWLRSLKQDGFVRETTLEAGKPYIIAFPNNQWYLPEYQVYGTVEFWGENVKVMAATDPLTPLQGPGYEMYPTFHPVEASEDVYGLVAHWINYAEGKSFWGKSFAPGQSANSFEGYVKLTSGAKVDYIDLVNATPEDKPASRAVGGVPQESDM